MTEIIATYENKEYGIKSFVTTCTMGFYVSLKDTDADKFVGECLSFADQALAIAKAKELVA